MRQHGRSAFHEDMWTAWMRSIPTIWWLSLGVVTIVGAWLRLRYLDGPMRYDESFTVWRYAARGIGTVVGSYSLPNNHVFHTLLVHATMRVAGGMEPWIVRLPAFVAGVTLVPTSYLVFARLSGRLAGLLTASLVAGWSTLIDYSANARGYAIAAVLGLVAVGVAGEIRARANTGWLPIWLGVVGAVGVWTVPVFLYIWVPVLLWLLLPPSSQTVGRRISNALIAGATSLAAGVVLYSPVLLRSGLSALAANRFVRPEPFPDFLRATPGFLTDVVRMWSNNIPLPIAVGVSAGAVYCFGISEKARMVRGLAAALLIGVSAIMLIQHAIPYPRNWLPLLPVTIGMGAAGLASFTDRILTSRLRPLLLVASWAILAWLAASVVTAPTLSQEDGLVHAEEITRDLEQLLMPGDVVAAAIPSTAPLLYYFNLYGLPTDPLLGSEDQPHRYYVVTTADQTMTDVVEDAGLPVPISVRVVSAYPSGTLWWVSDTR